MNDTATLARLPHETLTALVSQCYQIDPEPWNLRAAVDGAVKHNSQDDNWAPFSVMGVVWCVTPFTNELSLMFTFLTSTMWSIDSGDVLIAFLFSAWGFTVFATCRRRSFFAVSLRRDKVPQELDEMRLSYEDLRHLACGARVHHSKRGAGIIVEVDMDEPRQKHYGIKFDNGRIHHYSKSMLAGKLQVLAQPASALLPQRTTRFTSGARVQHPKRGAGTVTEIRQGDPNGKPYHVQFDSGEVHRYH